MKKIIFILSLSSLALTSCSKSNVELKATTPPVVVEKFILPKKIVTTKADGSITSTVNYVYNGNKIVEVTSNGLFGNIRYVFTYTSNLITKQTAYLGAVLSSETIYTYENDKLIYDITTTNDRDITTGAPKITKSKQKYTYNADGTVTNERFTIDANGGEKNDDYTYIRTYANGNNVVFVTKFSTIKITENREFDNKNYHLKNILGIDKLVDAGIGIYGSFSSNNVIKITSKTENPAYTTQPAATITNYQYKYNADGYPTEETNSYTDPKNVVYTFTTQYFYE